jgi:hypothetical protein
VGMIEQDGALPGAAVGGGATAVAWRSDGPPGVDGHSTDATIPWWTTISRADLGGATLQWATGLFCAFVGAQMLVVPHQFGAQAYDSLRPNILGWGIATVPWRPAG